MNLHEKGCADVQFTL